MLLSIIMSVTGKITSVFPIERINVKFSGTKLQEIFFPISPNSYIQMCGLRIPLQENKSYHITNATIRSFNGEKYVSIGQQCEITMINDIGQVIDSENIKKSQNHLLVTRYRLLKIAKT